MDGLTLLLILLAFFNLLIVIAMVNQVRAESEERIAKLERKLDRIVKHLNIHNPPDDRS